MEDLKNLKLKYLKIDSVSHSYLVFYKVNEYFEENNKNKCLTLVSNNESKEMIKKYEGLWSKIRNLVRSTN